MAAPPFDDEGNEAVAPALARPLAAEITRQDQAECGPTGPVRHDQPSTGPGEQQRTQPGSAGGWPSQFAQVLAEALAGSRPARQLAPWTTEQARRRIRQLGPMLATSQRPKVRRVMTSAPAADVLEMTAVVGFGPRVRVLALRLERDKAPGSSRWCCTAIESA